MPAKDTKERILDTAEELFATQGFEATSLRQITTEANANLASIHYYFGSKEGLIHEIISRHMAPINRQRLEILEKLEHRSGEESFSVKEVLHAFIDPVILFKKSKTIDKFHFPKVLGRVMMESNELYQEIILKQFGDVVVRFQAAFRRVLPEIPSDVLIWRLHFMMGAFAQTMLNAGLVSILSKGQCESSNIEVAMRYLIDFVSAGLQAPVTSVKEDSTQ